MATEIGRLIGDYACTGTFSPRALTIPAGSILNAAVGASAAIAATKLCHRVYKIVSQPNTTATSVTQLIHLALAAGVLHKLRAVVQVAAIGGATITIDLQKNGVSVLSAPMSITSALAANVYLDATITTSDYVADDVFKLVITAAAGGGTIPTGLLVQLSADENPS